MCCRGETPLTGTEESHVWGRPGLWWRKMAQPPSSGLGAPGSSGPAQMTLVSFFSPQVTHLLIRKPPLFHYRPGDYLYLNIPTIAHHEWHPFTISSAPEQKGRPAPAPPVTQQVLLSPCHVPSKAGNQEHRGEQDQTHKVDLPKLQIGRASCRERV